jgi:hypothetical protein
MLAGPASPAGARIYWTAQGGDAIGRARADGTGAIRDFIAVGNAPRGLAITGKHVYWSQGGANGTVGRARLNGTRKRPAFISTGRTPQGVALDSFGVYWTHTFAGAGQIGHAGLDGAGVVQGFIPTDPNPCGVAADPDELYWANGGTPGAIGKAHGPFDFEQDFLVAGGDPCGVAVTGRHIYWANRGGNGIARSTRDGTRVRQHFIDATRPCGVAVDESRLYWTSQATDAIGTARLDGSHVNPALIMGLRDPCGVAVEPTTRARPSSYEYRSTPVGAKGPIHAFLVQNTSSSVLDVRAVRITGLNSGDFKITGDGCRIAFTAPAGGCVINARFQPAARGLRQATISVISNASDSPTSVSISGLGTAP